MLPDLAPYALTTLAVASFTLAIAHVRMRPTTVYVAWTWLVGAFLVLCSVHFGFTQVGVDGGEATFDVRFHAFLKVLFTAIAAGGVPTILINVVVPRERP